MLEESLNLLKSVKGWNAELLKHLIIVLIEGELHRENTDKNFQSLEIPDEIKPHRATAANPRAYKGTKDRPPKQKNAFPIDLTVYLNDEVSLVRILKKLAPYWTEAIASIPSHTFSEEGIQRLSSPLYHPADIYCVYYYGILYPKNDWPTDFQKHWLPIMKRTELCQVKTLLKNYWDLQTNDHTLIRRLIEREDWQVLFYLPAVSALKEENQSFFIECLLNSEEYYFDWDLINEHFTEIFLKIFEIGGDKAFLAERIHAFLKALDYGTSPKLLLIGLELIKDFYPEYKLSFVDKYGADFELEDFLPFSFFVNKHAMLRLWEFSGNFEEFSKVLRHNIWQASPEKTKLKALLDFALYSYCDVDSDDWDGKVFWLTDNFDDYMKDLKTIPLEQQDKYLSSLRNFFSYWDNQLFLNRFMPIAKQIISKDVILSNDDCYNACETISYFIDETDSDYHKTLLELPDTTWKQIERAHSSRNDSKLIIKSIEVFIKADANFLLQSLEACPTALMKLLKNLGSLAQEEIIILLNQWKKHELYWQNLDKLSSDELYHKLSDHRQDFASPFPKKLRKHYEENYSLTERQLERAFLKTRSELPYFQIKILNHLFKKRLYRGFENLADNDAEYHALQMLNFMEDNQRSLRRFLKEKGSKQDFLQKHPLNSAWLQSLPAHFDTTTWLNGFSYETEYKGEKVSISLELDPFEVLQMGSYVGSCFGLGGIYAKSAAANCLDANKQVLFMRKQDGKFIARQQIAINENHELVCFETYPYEDDSQIQKSFADYNLLLAKKLRTKIHREANKDKKSPEISFLISSSWWLDWFWNPKKKATQARS